MGVLTLVVGSCSDPVRVYFCGLWNTFLGGCNGVVGFVECTVWIIKYLYRLDRSQK